MADTQQGVRHQSARDAAGTVDTYDGDLRALFNAVATVPAGSTFNEAFMLWLQSVTGSSADNINDLAALYASQQDDTYNWSSVGSLGLPTLFSWDRVNGQELPAGAVFTRVPVAQEYDGTDFTQVGSGVIRDDSAAVFGGAKGFLAEIATINRVVQSTNFGDSAWVKADVTETDLGVGALGLNEYSISADATSAVHRLDEFVVSVAGDGYFIAKAGAGGQFLIVARGGGVDDYACFDLSGGTVSEEGAGLTSSDIVDLGNGYYQCGVVTADTNGGFRGAISNTGTPGTSVPSFLGAGEILIFCHAQFTTDSFHTSPIITAGSSVTRAADILDTGAVIASEFGCLLDLTLPLIIPGGGTITLLGPDATAEDIIRVDSSFNVIMDDGGTPATIGTSSAGARIKVSYGRSAASRSGSLDGATVVTGDAPGAGHEGDTFQLGAANSANQSRCIHHNSVIYSVRPSDNQLESLST